MIFMVIKGWVRETYDDSPRLKHYYFRSIKKRIIGIRKNKVTIDGEIAIKPFKTNKAAMDYAIKYMKAHPRG